MVSSVKQGYGSLTQLQQPITRLIEQCTSRTYKRIIEKVIEEAERASDTAKTKVKKVAARFMNDELKEVIKKYNKPFNP
jgi:hypothetical protein